MVFRITAAQFKILGIEMIIGFDHTRTCEAMRLRRWHAYFGASPETCSEIFVDLQRTQVEEARVKRLDAFHFLIAFYWLKGNEPDEKLAVQFKLVEKTARKWKWYYLRKIEALRAEKVTRSWCLYLFVIR
jgi:hypothetical protein